MIPDMAAGRPPAESDPREMPVVTDPGSLPTVAPAGQILALDARAAARAVGVSRAHWLRLVSTGRAPQGIRLGRARRWAIEDLRAWVAADCPPADRWEAQRGRGGRP